MWYNIGNNNGYIIMFESPYVSFFMLDDADQEYLYTKVKNYDFEGVRSKYVVARYEGKSKIIELNESNLRTLKSLFEDQ